MRGREWFFDLRQDHQRTGALERKTPFDGGRQLWSAMADVSFCTSQWPRLIYRESLRNPKERPAIFCNDHVTLDQWVNHVLSRLMMAHHEAKTPILYVQVALQERLMRKGAQSSQVFGPVKFTHK